MTVLEKAGLLVFIMSINFGPADGSIGFFLLVLMLMGLILFMQGAAIDAAIEKRIQEKEEEM